MRNSKLSLRVRGGNLNHHLWNNNGMYWCHFTVHLADFTKERRRLSLGTDNLGEARRLRDALLATFGGEIGLGDECGALGTARPTLESEVASC